MQEIVASICFNKSETHEFVHDSPEQLLIQENKQISF